MPDLSNLESGVTVATVSGGSIFSETVTLLRSSHTTVPGVYKAHCKEWKNIYPVSPLITASDMTWAVVCKAQVQHTCLPQSIEHEHHANMDAVARFSLWMSNLARSRQAGTYTDILFMRKRARAGVAQHSVGWVWVTQSEQLFSWRRAELIPPMGRKQLIAS